MGVFKRIRQARPELLHQRGKLLDVAHAGGELLVDGRAVLVADVELHLLVHAERTPSQHRQVSASLNRQTVKVRTVIKMSKIWVSVNLLKI